MLEILDVSKNFQNKVALSHVSLTVENGEFLSILGPSGCGKTTLLRMIAGLETPDQGSLRLDGIDITHTVPHKRNVHTVFQRYALFPHMNVFDNVAFGLRCKNHSETEIRKRVMESLDLANLSGLAGRAISTLSGGEQQRVALIRALVNLPKLLLLDEPLGALDLQLRLQLQQELVSLQKRVKTTFVFVTHDQQEALVMSDRIAVLSHGLLEQVGTPQEIYEFPKSLFVANFIGAINKMEGTLRLNSEGRTVVEVPQVGQFNVDLTNQTVSAGTRGVLCLRPEKLAVYARRPTNAENVVEGVIASMVYLGTHTQFEVQLASGGKILVFQQNIQKTARKPFQLSDKIYMGWQTSMSLFFPEAST